MIRVEPKLMLVMFRGIYTHEQIKEAILKATKKKTVNWKQWKFAGFGDDAPGGITTALPFSPPDVDREEVGFKRTKK